MSSQTLVPAFMFSLGMATGLVMRDELNMPTYLRIKMALVEHSILCRSKLDPEVLYSLDPNQGRLRIQQRT